jgi:hypothetical protein
MEILAFTYSAVAYEDPSPPPSWQGNTLFAERPAYILKAASGLWATGCAIALSTALITVLSAALAAPASALQVGDTGFGVEALQRALQAEGFYDGRVTGYFGAQTQGAVFAYQRAVGLPVTGVAGPETLSALALDLGLGGGGGVGGGGIGGGGIGGGGGSIEPDFPTVGPDDFISGRFQRGVVRTRHGVGINVRLSPAGQIIDGKPDGTIVAFNPRSSVFRSGYTWVQTARGTWVARDFLIAQPGGDTRPPFGGQVYRVTALRGITVHSSPDGFVIGTLPQGTLVELTREEVFRGGKLWGQLVSDRGWVAKDGLTLVSAGGGGSGGGVPLGTATVTASALIVRDAPAGRDTGATLFRGDRVFLTGLRQFRGGRDWAERTNGTWVAADYLRLL